MTITFLAPPLVLVPHVTNTSITDVLPDQRLLLAHPLQPDILRLYSHNTYHLFSHQHLYQPPLPRPPPTLLSELTLPERHTPPPEARLPTHHPHTPPTQPSPTRHVSFTLPDGQRVAYDPGRQTLLKAMQEGNRGGRLDAWVAAVRWGVPILANVGKGEEGEEGELRWYVWRGEGFVDVFGEEGDGAGAGAGCGAEDEGPKGSSAGKAKVETSLCEGSKSLRARRCPEGRKYPKNSEVLESERCSGEPRGSLIGRESNSEESSGPRAQGYNALEMKLDSGDTVGWKGANDVERRPPIAEMYTTIKPPQPLAKPINAKAKTTQAAETISKGDQQRKARASLQRRIHKVRKQLRSYELRLRALDEQVSQGKDTTLPRFSQPGSKVHDPSLGADFVGKKAAPPIKNHSTALPADQPVPRKEGVGPKAWDVAFAGPVHGRHGAVPLCGDEFNDIVFDSGEDEWLWVSDSLG